MTYTLNPGGPTFARALRRSVEQSAAARLREPLKLTLSSSGRLQSGDRSWQAELAKKRTEADQTAAHSVAVADEIRQHLA